MNPTLKTILSGLITAAIVANVSVLWSFNARLARIEQILSLITPHIQLTQTNEH